jgi:type I restriction enzyme S subunit
MVKADCFRFRLDEETANPRFIAHQLNASAKHAAGTLATGSTRSRIPLSIMMTRMVALPPVAEQLQVVLALQDELSKIERLSLEAERSMLLLQERRSALISAAVTGKIDVRGRAGAPADLELA